MNIIKSIKPIVNRSVYIHINREKIKEFSKYFQKDELRHWLNEAPFDISTLDDESKLGFLFVFNAISFSYWGDPKWSINYLGKKYDGSWAMIASLARAIEEGKPILSPNYLEKIEAVDLDKILRGNITIPLLEERLEILRELGYIIKKYYGGKFSNMIKSAKNDAIKLLNVIINKIPSFNDYCIYDGQKILFYKRAQLLISDIYYIFKGEDYGRLNNIEKLTACADYKLPQVLHKLGILNYNKKLAKKIDNKIEIKKCSREEIEIRANTIFAIELIKEQLKVRISDITSSEISNYLWLTGQIKSIGDRPYHRTRTISY